MKETEVEIIIQNGRIVAVYSTDPHTKVNIINMDETECKHRNYDKLADICRFAGMGMMHLVK